MISRNASGNPSPRWMTAAAFVIVVVPFVIIVGRLLAGSSQHIYLPDDLALIDLHTRRALEWKQQLGVFDRNGWNHPGPAMFYVLSLAYRVLGNGAKALFVGATLINALAAVGCVALVRRRTTPARALWAAVWLCGLGALLAATGAGATTYSEGALGALVSPWNPMLVIFPLLLFMLLCAGAMDRSGLSVLGALLVGSFVVQTDFSTLPLVAVLFVVVAAAWGATAWRDRRRRDQVEPASDATSDGVEETAVGDSRRPWKMVAAVAGAVVFVVMWLPPVVQQLTNHPGNATLIYRFFTSGQPGHSLDAGVNAVAAVFGVTVVGPAEVMSEALGFAPKHLAVAVVVSAAIVALGVLVVAVGFRQRNRFAVSLGALGLIGSVTMVLAVTQIVGHVFGYLVIWAVVLPVAILIGVGMLRPPLSMSSAPGGLSLTTGRLRTGLSVLAVVACVIFGVRVLSIPSLSRVSNEPVQQLATLVTPKLPTGGPVFVGDNGAGTGVGKIIDLEEFIGLVNQLDIEGYHPKVNPIWKPEFGPGYVANGNRRRVIIMSDWQLSSPSEPGYVGRVGDMAVSVTDFKGS